MTRTRIKRIFENAGEEIGAILIYNGAEPHQDVNFFYVTDLVKGLFESSAVVIYPEGSGIIITSRLEAESASRSPLDTETFSTKKEFHALVKKALDVDGNVGINFEDIPHSTYRKFKYIARGKKFVDVSKVLENTRMIKDEKEIKKIKKAGKIATESLDALISQLYAGIKEYEAAALLMYEMMKRGATGPAFETISSFGENSAEPHYTAGFRSLRAGDIALFDFGARFERYNSDITRTFVMGKTSEKHRKIYEIVREAQHAGIEAIMEGVMSDEVDAAARKIIEREGYGDKFIHSLGHGLGLKVHDAGALSPNMKIELKENMVFTVEPGIYISGFGGIRIEDDVLVKKNRAEILTQFPKDLIEL